MTNKNYDQDPRSADTDPGKNDTETKDKFGLRSSLRTVSSSPHIRSDFTVTSLMGDVILALLFPLAWGVYIFGFRALSLTLVSVISCVFFEALYELIMRKAYTVKDLSAVVTGMLIAFNLPVNAPLWLPVAGGAFAILIVKMLFGGIGKNIVNPAIAARIFLFISFPRYLSSYFNIEAEKISPFAVQPDFDALTSATPLTFLKRGELPDVDIFRLLLGQHGGTIGEVSSLLLVACGFYLLIKKVISWHIPFAFLGTVAGISLLFPRLNGEFVFMPAGFWTGRPVIGDAAMFMLCGLLSGGLILGAVFMATDYVTSPITKKGKLIFGAGCGLITVFIRYFGGYPEGVAFSIMIMNMFVWYLDKVTKPVIFGGGKNAGKQ